MKVCLYFFLPDDFPLKEKEKGMKGGKKKEQFVEDSVGKI